MRRLPPLGSLRAFEAAARLLSFRLAAQELGLTPTAISHQVRLLEAYCGGTLFRRRPRPLALTPAGAALFPVLRDGFDSLRRDAEPHSLARRSDELSGSRRPTPSRAAGSCLDLASGAQNARMWTFRSSEPTASCRWTQARPTSRSATPVIRRLAPAMRFFATGFSPFAARSCLMGARRFPVRPACSTTP